MFKVDVCSLTGCVLLFQQCVTCAGPLSGVRKQSSCGRGNGTGKNRRVVVLVCNRVSMLTGLSPLLPEQGCRLPCFNVVDITVVIKCGHNIFIDVLFIQKI